MSSNFDFTESAYVDLLIKAKQKYRFIRYSDELNGEDIILWRHDVDLSVHRALRMAEIDDDLGIKSTFFIQLGSSGYNVFEPIIANLIFRIIDKGHQIGLHFDPSLYASKPRKYVFEKIIWERNILETLFQTEIYAVSFHNPECDNWILENSHMLCGMVNTYSIVFKENFGYCSDSNGYWRFENLNSVLQDKKHSRLQVLTHPEWWTLEAITPRKRVKRCFEGRAKSCLDVYDRVLREMGRENCDE